MTSKPHDASKPTFYLDQSTLCDAFDAQGPYQALRPWVEEVAREANLCLSLNHVLELAQWPDVPKADQIVKWLDGLPLVWCYMRQHTELAEAKYWLKVATGVTPAESATPFAPSMLRALASLRWDQISEILANPTLPRMIQDIRGPSPVWRDRARRFSMEQMADRFRQNKEWADQKGWTVEQKARNLAENREIRLRDFAMAAKEAMLGEDDKEFDWAGDDESLVAMFIEFVNKTPAAMPGLRTLEAFTDGFREAVWAMTPGSGAYKSLKSIFYDLAHLIVGAAYCDVFTCDRLVSRCLGNVREAALGRQRQLAVEKGPGLGPGRFVGDLIASWPGELAPAAP